MMILGFAGLGFAAHRRRVALSRSAVRHRAKLKFPEKPPSGGFFFRARDRSGTPECRT